MSTTTLATRFTHAARSLRTEVPLTEEQMRVVAPSVFAAGKHASRSERYAYIPTIDVLRGLKREGFEPFMVAQGASRAVDKAAHTKHLVRLRHAGAARARDVTHEIILVNSHDGASCYQLIAGAFRLVCRNGLVVGDIVEDMRVAHKGNAQREVIEGATRVLGQFEAVDASIEAMKALRLEPHEESAFATAALALRFGSPAVEQGGGHVPAPVTAEQVNEARRVEDVGHDLWAVLQRAHENLLRGGQPGRSASGRRVTTRPIAAIDRSIGLNRALWTLAEEMRRIKH